MAYPTAEEIRNMLPGDIHADFDAEIDLAISAWKARVADAAGKSEAPPGDPIAEDIVREGAYGRSYKKLLILDGHAETPSADRLISEANTALTRYDERNKGEKEPGRVNPNLVSNVSRSPLWDANRRHGYGSPLSEHFDDNW